MGPCGTSCEPQGVCGQVDRRPHQDRHQDSGGSNEKTTYFYSYPDPSKYSVKLVAVKEDALYNPRLPTLRRMEMDAYCGRLADEHSRTTSTCYTGDFRRATTTMFARAPHMLPSLGITDTGRKILKHSYIPDELNYKWGPYIVNVDRCTRVDWTELANRCPESFNVPAEDRPVNCSNTKGDCSKEVEFTGYAVRHLRPCITAAWKLPLARYMPLPLQHKTCPEPWCGGSY